MTVNYKLSNYLWALTERFGASAVSLVGNIVLAALLTPDDFGLLAMLGVFTSLVYLLVDCGMSDGLLREPAPTSRDFNTLFFFNMVAGAILALVFVLLAPLVAWFFARDELCPIMMALGLVPLFCALAISQSTLLRSQMRFRHVALVNIGAVVLALAVAIALAMCGMHYWALVELQVGFSAFYWLLLIVTSRWHIKWEFDRQRCKQLWRFGANLMASTMAVLLSQNIVALLLGKFYSASQAGFMAQAQKLQQAPVAALEGSVSSTTYVMVGKETDPAKQDQAFVAVFRTFSLMLLVGCAIGIVMARPIVGLLFAERWLPTVPYLQLLLAWAMVYPMVSFMAVMLKLRNRTDLVRNISLAERLAIVIAALLLWRWGVVAMLSAFIFISALAALCSIWQVGRVSTIRPARLLAIYVQRLLPAAFIILISHLL